MWCDVFGRCVVVSITTAPPGGSTLRFAGLRYEWYDAFFGGVGDAPDWRGYHFSGPCCSEGDLASTYGSPRQFTGVCLRSLCGLYQLCWYGTTPEA